jgi:hypothetical protein
MSIRTQRVCAFEDEAIVLSFDWDDATGDVVLARCVNASPRYAVHVVVSGTGTGAAGRSFERTLAAGSGLTEVSIPGGQRPRFPVGPDPFTGETTVLGWRMAAGTIG